MAMPKQYKVVELPEGATGQEIEDALNEAAEAGYYNVRMTTGDPGLALRAIFCLRKER
jgi:hypothetical protein